MKTLILRKDLTAKRLSYQMWLFFSKLKINSIYIDRISLTLNNNQEFILIEDINVDKTNTQELQTIKKLIVKNYLNICKNNNDINIGKESDYIMFFYKETHS